MVAHSYARDPIQMWIAERLAVTGDKPVGGWPFTKDLYSDFKSWIDGKVLFIPPAQTFSQHLRNTPGVALTRWAAGTRAVGCVLKGDDI